MIKSLRLRYFKNFGDVELHAGPFTSIVGTNASGKSNLRDAFRFLHGLSRGYNLAETIGEKWGINGVLEWQGIRGGLGDLITHGEVSSTLEVELELPPDPILSDALGGEIVDYKIKIGLGDSGRKMRVLGERWEVDGRMLAGWKPEGLNNGNFLDLFDFGADYSLFPSEQHKARISNGEQASLFRRFEKVIKTVRFLDLSPAAMRVPSVPGALTLGDRGENLSSVLQRVCNDPSRKEALLEWVKELTPMDAVDLEFPADQIGRVLVTLVEGDGSRTSAYSASDGTLRFLAMIAALLGPEEATFYFFEELENGIHPTRLHLLLNLIEQTVRDGKIQIVATSHSPSMLRYLSEESLEYASLVYRPPGEKLARIKRVVDIEGARDLIKKQDLGRLLDSGWLEDAMFFSGGDGEASEGDGS